VVVTRPRPDIEIHVERLVLHGVDAGGRHAIADQLIAALEPALAEHGLGPWAVDGAEIDRVSTSIAPGQSLGAAISSTLTPGGRT
jgi:hypothetical protein